MNFKYREKRVSNTTSPARVWGFILAFLVCLSFFLAVGQVVVAGDYGNYGLDDTTKDIPLPGAGAAKIPPGGASGFLSTQVGRMVGFFLAFTGVAFMVLIIVAGTVWMNAAGNEQTVTKAKDIIIAAVVGLIITLAAYAITKVLGDFLMGPPKS